MNSLCAMVSYLLGWIDFGPLLKLISQK